MKIGLKCPACKHTYYPKPEDAFGLADDFRLMDKIFLRRYGQDNRKKNIECIICSNCDSISYVQISIIKSIFSLLASLEIFFGDPFAIISPYKLYTSPTRIQKIRDEVNEIHDISGESIHSILENDFSIPPHIFKFLSKIGLLTVDKLGLKYRGKYHDGIHRSVAYFSSDEYSFDEMRERWDTHDRTEQIKNNKEQNNPSSHFVDKPKKNNKNLNSDLNAVSIQLQEIERDNAIELDRQQAETKKQLRNKERNSTKKMGMTGKLKKLSEIFLISSGDLLIEMSKIGLHKVNEYDTISADELKIIIRHLSDNGNASAQSMQAQYFYTDKKYKDAFNLWNKALLQEEILPKDTLGIITHNIGLAYYSGNGTTIDKEEAVEWFIESSDIGGIQSQNSEYNLASMFLTGNGVKKNITKAKLWANKAITGENHEVSFNAKQILAKCTQIEVLDRVANSDKLPF